MHRVDLGEGISAVFTDRLGGVSASPYAERNLGEHVGDDPAAVTANRGRLAAAVGLGAGRIVWMRQVHGRGVAVVDAPVPEPIDGVDALVTTAPRLALAVLVADCAPVLLADPTAGVVAAAHAGRRGLQAGVVPAAIARMRSLGADPTRVRAAVGPTICGRCYEVSAAVQDEVAQVEPAARCRTRCGTPGLDLAAGLTAQLAAAGVGPPSTSPACTAEDPALYSYRRDGVTGRFAGLVWRDPGGIPATAQGRVRVSRR